MINDKVVEQIREHINNENLNKETKMLIAKLAEVYMQQNKTMNMADENITPNISIMRYKYLDKDNDDNKITGSGITIGAARTKLKEYLRIHHNEKFLKITDDKYARAKVEEEIKKYVIDNGILISKKTIEETIEILTKDLLDYGILTDFIFDYNSDERIEEARINEIDDIRYVIKGQEHKTKLKFDNPDQLMALAVKICRNSTGLMIRKDNPFVRARLGNNIRISIMINPVARRSDDNSRPVVHMVIRKQSPKPLTKEFLIESETINEYGYELISTLMKYGMCMNFYGGTNSGKTGTMGSIVYNVFGKGNDTRTITIAEIDEMNLRQIDPYTGEPINNVLMWEEKQEIGMNFRTLVNSSLTFTPETIIIQEIKGAETVDLIDASITGHQVLTTSHARNLNVLGKRMLGMYKQSGSDLNDDLILEYVADAFDLLVRMKIYRDGKRRIADISEILSYDRTTGKFKTNTLLKYTVDESIEVKEIDKYTNQEVINTRIKGRHIAVNPMSEALIESLVENGINKKNLDHLNVLYNQCQRGDDIHDNDKDN